jgi:tetratricopeptide (TPR) repeat protein
MMASDKFTTQTLKASHQAICKALFNKKVKEAFDLLTPFVKGTHDSDLIDTHYNLEFNYKSMLKYMVEGITDPERQKIYQQQISEIYSLVDKVFDHLLTKFSSEIYYETRRNLQQLPLKKAIEDYYSLISTWELRKLADAKTLLSEEEQTIIYQLFNAIWTQSTDDSDTHTVLVDLFRNESTPWYHKALFVSAIVLATLQTYNKTLLVLLMELTNHSRIQVNTRAMVGLLILLYQYDDRIKNDTELNARIKLFSEKEAFITLLKTFIIQLIRTRETEKISKKMTDEILPEVVKIHPKIKDKLDLENMISDRFMEDKNPEWEDVFQDSPELLNKLEELSKWQMEGADVFLTTFKMLKHFPFFNQLSNWVLPFHLDNTSIAQALENETVLFTNKDILQGLSDSRFLCNSDKYSLLLSMQHMPQAQKEMMSQMFNAELQQMTDIEKDEKSLDANQQKYAISNQYIQDLYRLFKVHPQHKHFKDIFSWDMSFHTKWFFNLLLPDEDIKFQIGEYFFKRDYFSEALEIFQSLLAKDATNKAIIQKIAYSYQHLEDYEKALEYYLHADLYDSESAWNKKKIALCYRHLKNPEKALEFYQQAEKLTPNNLHTQASIGHCLLELKNHEEALRYYFKVEYLDDSNTKVWRPIAWCSFVLGKFEQAEKYYQKLVVLDKNKHDLMNLGHVLWCNGNRKEALSIYQKSILLPDHSLNAFIDAFYNDMDVLLKNGILKEDLPIMLDQICYSMEN